MLVSSIDNEIIDQIITNEGGLVDHSNDKGGRTNWGITQNSWAEYCRMQSVEETVVDHVSLEQARGFYRDRFDRAKISLLPVRFWYAVADWQVNSGIHAITNFQRVLNTLGEDLKEDGYLGQVTAHVARAHNISDTLNRYVARRIQFLRQNRARRSYTECVLSWLDQPLFETLLLGN